MKAVVCTGTADGGTSVVDVPDPVPAAGEVVVEVEACGLCGSDVHAVEHGQVGEGQILGHELSGRVVEVARDVDAGLVGTAVAVNPIGGCGRCAACVRGLPFRCSTPNVGITRPGAFAQYVAAPAAQLVPVPGDVPLERVADAEPLAVALAAVDLARVRPGDAVLVYGVGPIGLNVIVALRLAGVERIVAAGRSPGRRAAAAAVGATDVIDTREVSVREHARAEGLSYAAVLECSAAPSAVPDAMAVLGPGGVCVVVALAPHEVPVALFPLLSEGQALVGSCAFDTHHYRAAVDHIVTGRAGTHTLVSEEVDLVSTPDALQRLRTPGELVRILTRPQWAAVPV